MGAISLEHVLALSAVLFVLGLIGVLARKSLLFMLLGVEIMLNAAGLAFVAAGSRWMQPDGQVMFIFILAMAAAEVSVGLALVLLIYRRRGMLDPDTGDPLSSRDAAQRDSTGDASGGRHA